jgi:hypothetical protein
LGLQKMLKNIYYGKYIYIRYARVRV